MLEHLNIKLIKVIEGQYKKQEILEKMVELIDENTSIINNKTEFLKNIIERESIGSTGIGMGIAIPHARCEGLKDMVVSICVIEHPVNFEAIDAEPIKVIVMVGAPKEKGREYLQFMSNIAKIFRNRNNRDNIKTARTTKGLIEAIMEIEY